MAYDLAPLRSYVRFYQTVVSQLTAAWDALARTHDTARIGLTPVAKSLEAVHSAAMLAAIGAAPPPPPTILGLWQPQDAKGLSGLTDVYEVVGRFTFQGEDDENLSRVQSAVSAARNEIHAQRTRLAELAKLPELARSNADRFAAEEARHAAQRKADRLASFAPLAQVLHQRARQSVEAVRGVPVPPLDDVGSAADEYRAFATKLDQVYQTCLPFLRKSLGDMYEFAGCEVPSSWPETLPVQHELPAEMLHVPPADSPEVMQGRATMDALQHEESELVRTRDDIAVTLARLEGDLASHVQRDTEFVQEIERAGMLASYATVLEQLEEVRRGQGSIEQQKAHRSHTIGELTQRRKQTESAIVALEQELKNRTQEIGQVGQQLAVERDNEPAIFGKDDWRGRVAALERQVEDLRGAFAQRQGLLNQLRIDLSSLGVQIQTEQSQIELLDRWLAESAARMKSLQAESRDLDGRLGAGRALRSPSVAEAENLMAARQNERAENQERIDRLRTESRRHKEDNARVLARLKQIDVERQRMSGYLQSAQVAATQGREIAMKQLAARRRAAVDQHVNEVLGGLEKSLNSVDAVFVEPAKDAMLRMDEPRASVAEEVRKGADKLAPVVELLVADLEPQLLAQDAMLGQVQREFCDVAPNACRTAWGAAG